MFLSELIQRIVHLFDVGAGSRVLRIVMVGLMAFALGLWYDLRDFQNFSTPEAMDSAQLARNIGGPGLYHGFCPAAERFSGQPAKRVPKRGQGGRRGR